MGLVIKNIITSFKAFKRIYLTLIISQIISILLLFLSYGIFGSFNLSQKEYETSQKQMWAVFEEDVCIEELKPVLYEVLNDVENKLDYFFVGSVNDSGYEVSVHNEYNSGSLSFSRTISDNIPLLLGRFPTEYEMNAGANVVVSSYKYEIGTIIELGEEEYEIIGIVDNPENENYIGISLEALPNTQYVYMVSLYFDRYPSISDYELFKSKLESTFGNNVKLGEFEAADIEQIIAMKSIVVISVIVGIVAALDTALLYGYIMEKRRKQVAIMGIVGANRIQRVLINELEMLLITVTTSIIGLILFRYIFEGLIQKMYENIMEIYYSKVYFMMLVIYIASVVIITLILTITKTGNAFLHNKNKG